MPIATVKVLTILIKILEELGIIILKTFKKLQTLLEAKQQLIAIYKEIAIYNRVCTQRLERRTNTRKHKVLRRRQVFNVKRGPNGKYSRFKVRQVIKGFSQKEGIDYNKTYVLVAKLVSLRVLFAMLVDEDLKYY